MIIFFDPFIKVVHPLTPFNKKNFSGSHQDGKIEKPQLNASVLSLKKKSSIGHNLLLMILKQKKLSSPSLHYQNRDSDAGESKDISTISSSKYTAKINSPTKELANESVFESRKSRFIKTKDILSRFGLLDITISTAELIRRNQILQKDIADLRRETSELIKSVMANPENATASLVCPYTSSTATSFPNNTKDSISKQLPREQLQTPSSSLKVDDPPPETKRISSRESLTNQNFIRTEQYPTLINYLDNED